VTISKGVEATTLNRLLRMAVMGGVESAVRIHVARGDDLNARDHNGLTPLMLAAARNRSSVCKILLESGVDSDLTSPSGQDALAIARAAVSLEAVFVIEAAIDLTPVAPPEDSWLSSLSSPTLTGPQLHEHELAPVVIDPNNEQTTLQEQSDTYLPQSEPNDHPPEMVDVFEDHLSILSIREIHSEPSFPEDLDVFLYFDKLNWEPEEERPPPPDDPTLAASAVAVHVQISNHAPIDTSADWDNLYFELPTVSAPFLSPEDADARDRLRLAFLRAIREGSIPEHIVSELTAHTDQSENGEATDLLIRTINDLGAEVDERFEYSAAYENFKVFVDPNETLEEDELISAAVSQIGSMASNRNSPLRIYLKTAQSGHLIDAKEEVVLAKAMEAGIQSALDTLAFWPLGVEQVFQGAKSVFQGRKPLSWIRTQPAEDSQDDVGNDVSEGPSAEIIDIDAVESTTNDAPDSEHHATVNHSDVFFAGIDKLSTLHIGHVREDQYWTDARAQIGELSLSRNFILSLADIAEINPCEASSCFTKAIRSYQQARTSMTSANLKLVYSIAKKYLYSGLPLDDLIQEGNIGLLKVVDKFDWRRGYKFSTYATWWIRQSVSRYVADSCRTIRIPVHFHEAAQQFRRDFESAEKALGREPSSVHMAKILNIPRRKVETLMRAVFEPEPIDESTMDRLFSDELSTPDPFDVVDAIEMIKAIEHAVSTLPRKDAQVIRMRYGIGSRDSLTLEEVGQQFEVTRERIRQIEAKALRRLLHPSRSEALTSWGPLIRPKRQFKEFNDEDDELQVELVSPETASAKVEKDIARAVQIGIQENKATRLNQLRASSDLGEQRIRRAAEVGAKLMHDIAHAKVNTTNQATKSNSAPSQITPPRSEVSRVEATTKPTVSAAIDGILLQAKGLGIAISRGSVSGESDIWVYLTETTDPATRMLVWQMMDAGFKYWPGTGYWK
jgi:RNA polymerase primary sigma factor